LLLLLIEIDPGELADLLACRFEAFLKFKDLQIKYIAVATYDEPRTHLVVAILGLAQLNGVLQRILFHAERHKDARLYKVRH